MFTPPKKNKFNTYPKTSGQESIESQSDQFLNGEGDNWYIRNKKLISDKVNFYDIEVIKRAIPDSDSIKNILEIGCGDATKLNALCSYFNAKGTGLDPSAMAIKSGKDKYNNLDLSIGTASIIPHPDDAFDLVYFGFCLYLIDRKDILKAIAEADRVLKKGGFLAILDFDPAKRHKKPYHHMTGIFTYKNSYSDFFTGGGHYFLVTKESFSHKSNTFSINSDERISISILFKEQEPY